MYQFFDAPPGRPPTKAQNKISRAIRSAPHLNLTFPPQPHVPRERLPQAELFYYRNARYHGQATVRRLIRVLWPFLYERHWTDKQVWFMLDWDWLNTRMCVADPSWQEPCIPNQLRSWLVVELRMIGFDVQEPLPPQTNHTALITWRASLYFKYKN